MPHHRTRIIRLKRPDIAEPVRRFDFDLSDETPIKVIHCIHNGKSRAAVVLSDMHYVFEIGIVLRGRMERRWEGHRRRLGRGESWITGAWEPHMGVVMETPCEVVVLVILPQALARISLPGQPAINWWMPFVSVPTERPIIPKARREEAARIAKEIVNLNNDAKPANQLLIFIRLLELLLILSQNIQALPESKRPPITSYLVIGQALQSVFLRQTLISAREIAQACRMGTSTFHRQFRRTMDISFAKFALRHRVAGAAAQLRNTADSVKKAASDWGFSHTSHLDRQMLKHYGCRPAEYRRLT